jgi:hypothetical protein
VAIATLVTFSIDRLWHKADMLNALSMSASGGKADSDQPLLTNLDL